MMQQPATIRRPNSCGLYGQQPVRPTATPVQARTSRSTGAACTPPSTTSGLSRAGQHPGQAPSEFSPASRVMPAYQNGQFMSGGYNGPTKATYSPAANGKAAFSPTSSIATTATPTSVAARSSTPTQERRQEPLSSGRRVQPSHFASPEQRLGQVAQAPSPNHLKFETPGSTPGGQGQQDTVHCRSQELSSSGLSGLQRANLGADQHTGREGRAPTMNCDWGERSGQRHTRGERSPGRVQQTSFRGPHAPLQQSQMPAPPKVQPQVGGMSVQLQELLASSGATKAGSHVRKLDVQDAPCAPRMPACRQLNQQKESGDGQQGQSIMENLQETKQAWFCSHDSSEELVSACANFVHLTLMPNKRTREHSLQNVRNFIDTTISECQYHNAHLVLALIYLERYHGSEAYKFASFERASTGIGMNEWSLLQKDIHVALHLAECWHPSDRDAPLKGSHVVKQSGLLGQEGEKKWPEVEDKKSGLYWEQWKICKALDWGLVVTQEDFKGFIELRIAEKKQQQVERYMNNCRGSGLVRGGMQLANGKTTDRATTQPPVLNRGVNSRSEPSVPAPREMLSPKHTDENKQFMPPARDNDEGPDKVGESDPMNQLRGLTGRSNNGPQQAPRPMQQRGGQQPSRATVGGPPVASDMRRTELNGAGNRPTQPQFDMIRGRDPRNQNGRDMTGGRDLNGRMQGQQPTPFSTAAPPPVSGRSAASSRLDNASSLNGSRFPAQGGTIGSALDSATAGSQLRITSAPTGQGGGHPRTPPATSSHTPRPHAFANGSMGANRPAPGPPMSGSMWGNSPARPGGIQVRGGMPNMR